VSAAIAPPPRGVGVESPPAVILAHGAGTDMYHPFLGAMQRGLADAGYVSVTFNFPYTEAGRRLPDRRPVLEECYRTVLDAVARDLAPPWIAIGGKSLGGRIASHLTAGGAAGDAPVRGLLLLGYPLHPAGRPAQLRAEHLAAIRVPMLFVQGTRDALCDLALLRPVLARLARATLHTIEAGDHSFHAPRHTGRTDAATWSEIVGVAADWLRTL